MKVRDGVNVQKEEIEEWISCSLVNWGESLDVIGQELEKISQVC